GEEFGKLLESLLRYLRAYRLFQAGPATEKSKALAQAVNQGDELKAYINDFDALAYLRGQASGDPALVEIIVDHIQRHLSTERVGIPPPARDLLLEALASSQYWDRRESLIGFLDNRNDRSPATVAAVASAARDFVDDRIPRPRDPTSPIYTIVRFFASAPTEEPAVFELVSRTLTKPDSRDSLAWALRLLGKNQAPDRKLYHQAADWLIRVAVDSKMQATRVLPGQDRYENIAQWEFSGRRYAMDGRQYEQVLDAAVTALRSAPDVVDARHAELTHAMGVLPGYLWDGAGGRMLREILAPVKPAEPQGTALLASRISDIEVERIAVAPCANPKVRRAWWRRIFGDVFGR
ncbi:MAG: hypothetical protein AAB425_04535, partial [Bdellovibrionota bacterium]